MPNSSEIFMFTQLYKWFEVLSAWVDGIKWTLFQKERKQEAHFDYCQRPLQADSTAHCKTVKEWHTHRYSVDMSKTSNFMVKTNTEVDKSTTAEVVTSKALPPGF